MENSNSLKDIFDMYCKGDIDNPILKIVQQQYHGNCLKMKLGMIFL